MALEQKGLPVPFPGIKSRHDSQSSQRGVIPSFSGPWQSKYLWRYRLGLVSKLMKPPSHMSASVAWCAWLGITKLDQWPLYSRWKSDAKRARDAKKSTDLIQSFNDSNKTYRWGLGLCPLEEQRTSKSQTVISRIRIFFDINDMANAAVGWILNASNNHWIGEEGQNFEFCHSYAF